MEKERWGGRNVDKNGEWHSGNFVRVVAVKRMERNEGIEEREKERMELNGMDGVRKRRKRMTERKEERWRIWTEEDFTKRSKKRETKEDSKGVRKKELKRRNNKWRGKGWKKRKNQYLMIDLITWSWKGNLFKFPRILRSVVDEVVVDFVVVRSWSLPLQVDGIQWWTGQIDNVWSCWSLHICSYLNHPWRFSFLFPRERFHPNLVTCKGFWYNVTKVWFKEQLREREREREKGNRRKKKRVLIAQDWLFNKVARFFSMVLIAWQSHQFETKEKVEEEWQKKKNERRNSERRRGERILFTRMALKQIKTERFEMRQEIDPKIEGKVIKKRRKNDEDTRKR